MKKSFLLLCIFCTMIWMNTESVDAANVDPLNNTQNSNLSLNGENKWGSSEYTLDNGLLTVSGGEIDLDKDPAPWTIGEVNPREIINIVFLDTVYLKGDASYFFTDLINLYSVNTEMLDVSQVTNMRFMFAMSPVVKYDISNWDTSSVHDMSYMFFGMKYLKEINLETWDTSNVTTMKGMFFNAFLLNTVQLSQWNVSNVNDFSSMFQNTFSLKNIDISLWGLSNKETTDMFLFSNVNPI